MAVTEQTHDITPADIIHTDRAYAPAYVAEALGIPLGTIQAARTAKEFRFGARGDGAIDGAVLLRWIHRCDIRCRISDEAREIYRRLSRQVPAQPVAAERTLAERAGERVEADSRARQAARDELVREYCDLLARYNQPKAGDDRQLARLLGELGLDIDQVERDVMLVSRLATFRERHESRGEAAEAARHANRALLEVSERARKDVESARVAQGRANAAAFSASRATYEAKQAARQRPELFEHIDAGDPGFPVLRRSSRLGGGRGALPPHALGPS